MAASSRRRVFDDAQAEALPSQPADWYRPKVPAGAALPVEGGDMRGYKVDSQGRKTTFFNNELDDKTKALIGDIAPKKVEKAVGLRAASVLA